MSWVKEVAEVVKEGGEAINKSGVIDKIGNAVNSLATNLGVAAKHVYEVLAKQAVVDSVTNTVLYLFFFSLVIIFAFLAKHFHKTSEFPKQGGPNAAGVGFVASCIASALSIIILFFFFINTITTTVTGYVNPEYKVIKEISEMLKEQTQASQSTTRSGR